MSSRPRLPFITLKTAPSSTPLRLFETKRNVNFLSSFLTPQAVKATLRTRQTTNYACIEMPAKREMKLQEVTVLIMRRVSAVLLRSCQNGIEKGGTL